VENLFWNTYH